MTGTKPVKVLVLTIGNGINLLINFLTLPYLVRSLSYEDYGSYGQVLIVLSLLQGLWTFNLNQVANIFFARNDVDQRIVFSTLMRSALLLSLGGGLVMLASVPLISGSFDNPSLDRLLFLSVVNLIGQIPVPIIISVMIFSGKVKRLTAILILTNLVKVGMMFVAIQYFNSVEMLMIGLSIVSIMQVVVMYFNVSSEIRSLSYFEKKVAKEIFRVATPLAMTSIIERLVFYIDGIMISGMLSTTDYALYRAGAVELPFIASLYGSVAAVVLPEVARLFFNHQHGEIIRLKKKVISTTAFLVYPVLVYLLFFAEPIVSFYLSEKYIASTMVFAIFNLTLLIRINDYQDIIIVSGNTRFIFYTIIILTIVNIGLNYILISLFGIYGSAMAFILHLFLLASALMYKTTKLVHCKISDMFDFNVIGRIIFISLLLVTPVWLIYTFILHSVLLVILAGPLYLLLYFLFGIKAQLVDPALVSQMKGRIFRKKD